MYLDFIFSLFFMGYVWVFWLMCDYVGGIIMESQLDILFLRFYQDILGCFQIYIVRGFNQKY